MSLISPDRFIVQSRDRVEWLEARERGVTATQVAKAATPAGLRDVLAQIESPVEVVPNAVMDWGNEREPVIAAFVESEFGIAPNDWLICAEGAGNEWMMATPDGLSADHKLIAEIKTSGKSLDKIPLNYVRQIQWQLFVTGAERCLFAWEQRLEGPEGFVPGLDVSTQWVERDDEIISELVKVAQKVQEHAIFFERAMNEGKK